MINAVYSLLQSRKFIVGTLAVGGAILVAAIGIFRGLPENAIIGLIGAITGVAWKLMDTIASEDNTKRLLQAADFVLVDDDGGHHGPTKDSN